MSIHSASGFNHFTSLAYVNAAAQGATGGGPNSPQHDGARHVHPGTETPILYDVENGQPTHRSSEQPYDPYNCFSYAWRAGFADTDDIENQGWPEHWDMNPWDEMHAAGVTKLAADAPKKIGDIVMYGTDSNGNGQLDKEELVEAGDAHAAVVIAVDKNGKPTRVQGKEGSGPITDHDPSDQNPVYGAFTEWYHPQKPIGFTLDTPQPLSDDKRQELIGNGPLIRHYAIARHDGQLQVVDKLNGDQVVGRNVPAAADLYQKIDDHNNSAWTKYFSWIPFGHTPPHDEALTALPSEPTSKSDTPKAV